MPKTITAEMLRDKLACSNQVAEFKRRFPNGVTFKSKRDAERKCRAVADVFDWNWAAENLLTAALRAEYKKAEAPLWAEYEKAKAPLWARYVKAKAPLWARYEKAKAALRTEYEKLRAEYEKAEAPLWARYEKAEAPLWARYVKAKAALFGRLFWDDER